MFTSGGGGFSLPNAGDPLQLLIVLLVLGAAIWLGFRLFDN